MMDEFKTKEELQERLWPALIAKVQEIKREQKININEQAVWDFLTVTKWSKTANLSLSDMVNDVFVCETKDIIAYLISNKKNEEKKELVDVSELL